MNRADRRAQARTEPPQLWYGLCTYWTEDWSKLSRGPSGIPCCPHCGSPGFLIDVDEWWRGTDRFEREGRAEIDCPGPQPGYRVFLERMREVCSGRGITTLRAWEPERQGGGAR